MSIGKLTGLALIAILLAPAGAAASKRSEKKAAAEAAKREKLARLEATIPVCEGEADCTAKWEAAQIWVVHNAAFRIQTATNVLIETYNSADFSETKPAVRVTKEPLGGGKYKFVIALWCNNPYMDRTLFVDAALNFNDTLNALAPGE